MTVANPYATAGVLQVPYATAGAPPGPDNWASWLGLATPPGFQWVPVAGQPGAYRLAPV